MSNDDYPYTQSAHQLGSGLNLISSIYVQVEIDPPVVRGIEPGLNNYNHAQSRLEPEGCRHY